MREFTVKISVVQEMLKGVLQIEKTVKVNTWANYKASIVILTCKYTKLKDGCMQKSFKSMLAGAQ